MLCVTAFFDKNSYSKATSIYIKYTANKLLDLKFLPMQELLALKIPI